MLNHAMLRHRRGTAAVEFALIVPVLTTMLFGMFETTYAVTARCAVERGARVAAHDYVISGLSADAARASGRSAVSLSVPADVITVDFKTDDGSRISTTVSVPTSAVFGFRLLPLPDRFTARIVMLKPV